MRVHAISDLHVDYPENLDWLTRLSDQDFTRDLLIVAGDVCEDFELLMDTLELLLNKFHRVCFIPGNHELWVANGEFSCSLEKFAAIREQCRARGVVVDRHREGDLTLIPLFGWYDYSFAQPDRRLRRGWRDYRACAWPEEMTGSPDINRHFLGLNNTVPSDHHGTVISYSHFLPRIDLMPSRIPQHKRHVYPVLGSSSLGEQVEQLQSDIHVYGHSHVNQSKRINGTLYINNAFGYPTETHIASKQLRCIFSDDQPDNP